MALALLHIGTRPRAMAERDSVALEERVPSQLAAGLVHPATTSLKGATGCVGTSGSCECRRS